jgi:predicted Zn-dependent peptidase
VSAPFFQKSKLDNGVRVLTESHPLNRAVCVGVFIDRGTRDEPDGLYGAAHFIEHLVFKGTRSRSGFEIAKSLEAVGGDLNAYTTREYTCFHTMSLSEHLDVSLDVLCDLVTNALMREKDFENERKVILSEADMSREQLDDWIFDLLFEGCYRGHPLGRSILGDRDSLLQMSRTRLKKYYSSVYQGERVIVAVSGNIRHDEVVKQVQERMTLAPSSSKKDPSVARAVPPARNFRKLMAKPAELAHILMSWPACSFTEELRFEGYVVNALLGGGMTSRMYQSLREERGLTYSVYSSLQSFTDCGLLTIYAATARSKAPEALRLLKAEVDKLVDEGIPETELNFYKTQIKGQILLGADDMENRMNSLGVNEMVFGTYRPVDQVIREIEAISVQSVRKYLDRFLNSCDLKAILLGDVATKSIENQLSKL